MAECPYIDRSFVPDPNFNKPLDFACDSGFVYRYYYHFDGIDHYYNCQFCSLIGRKRDVFECLNESEWHACAHYMFRHSREVTKHA